MNRRLFTIGLFLMATALLAARGNKEKFEEALVPVVQVAGSVRMVGNEPFTELIISNSQNAWYIAREERAKLKDLQHRVVTVEGEEIVSDIKFANGLPAGQRRELRNIRIIAIH